MSDVVIRRATEADEPLAISLLREGLGMERFDRSFWDWRYHGAPAGEGCVLVAEGPTGLVAVAGAFPYRLTAGSHELLGWFINDIFVHPEWRRQGIFTRLGLCQLEVLREVGGDLAFGFASEMSYRGFTQRLGYRHVVTVPYWVALSGGGPHASLRTLGQALLGAAGRVASLLRPRNRLHRALENLGIQADPSPAELAQTMVGCRIPGNETLAFLFSEECVAWRFGRHPWHRYETFLVCDQGTPVGYVTVRGQNVLAFGGCSGTSGDLAALGLALQRAAERGIAQVHCYCEGDVPTRQALREAGFVHWPWRARPVGLYSQQLLVVRVLREEVATLCYRPDAWRLQMADIACGL